MDDRSDVESTHSVENVYTTIPPSSANKRPLSVGAYGSNSVPIKSYSEGQQKRAEQIMRMIQNKEKAPEGAPDDTVHYMSPVSPLSDRSSYEGDYDYYRHLYNLHGRGKEESHDDGSLGTESTVSCHIPELQCTVAIIKPEAMQYEDVVIRAVKEAGFSIINSRLVHLSAEQVSEIQAQFYGTPAFPHMVVSMSVSPVKVLTLAGINAVAKWREMAGPDGTLREEWFYPMSMRTRFGIQPSIVNAIKASENQIEADEETRYFRPESILEPIVQEVEKVTDYCGQYVNPTLLAGLTELVRVKPVDPILYLAEWLLLNNPFQPRFPDDVAVTPT